MYQDVSSMGVAIPVLSCQGQMMEGVERRERTGDERCCIHYKVNNSKRRINESVLYFMQR